MASYHWQSKDVKSSGVDDMVLLQRIKEDAITENLKKRFKDDLIYTYIGNVLIAVNPFKQLQVYSDKHIDMYQGAGSYENPPHLYALSDNMFRNMMIDMESQCVIISGESGAGKTVSAKYIMSYVSKVSGGGGRVEEVKRIILQSNPLLEAFGNAKTVRNNNSSRFGKYVEIQFSQGGEPIGGKISQFLLEKSRVVLQNEGERNFHVFYQICAGVPKDMKEYLGITSASYFNYINQTGVYTADGLDDAKDLNETLEAMGVMHIDQTKQNTILSVVAGILHLGNVTFVENGNYAAVSNKQLLDYPAFLLGIDVSYLETKLTSRVMETTWGKNTENIQVTLNVEQAGHTRNGLAKALYSRLFDFIVDAVNRAMVTDRDELNLGILDIYGFEIFKKNGFEQFCINYVNEKLQQIFIELTLKAEQEEYIQEGISWKPVEYFNNKVVCDMIELKTPDPGIFCILDDICATMHAVSDNVDRNFVEKMSSRLSTHKHYHGGTDSFVIVHYAGQVSYCAEGFCERNRDQLNTDLIQMMQTSTNDFIVSLFPEKATTQAKRPTTVGNKIRSQANHLVERLMRCTPHYIRCIKPNETKRAGDWDDNSTLHQVTYLGLKENINVRRAGFAYRRQFDHFLKRYAILTKETWPAWCGDPKQGVKILLNAACIDDDQWQIGKTKLFVKNPESLFLLEERRERKYDHYARIIQKAFRRFNATKYYLRLKTQAADLLYQKKERRRFSLNRNFYGDYLFLDDRPEIRMFLKKREKVEFADSVKKYDRRFKPARRELILSDHFIYLIGREKIVKGPEKGVIKEVLKRKIELAQITKISMSTLCDDFIILSVTDDYDTLMEVKFKTEFVTLLNRRTKERASKTVPLVFSDTIEFAIKKEGWGGGGTRKILFSKQAGTADVQIKTSGKTLNILVPSGLDKNSRPGNRDKVGNVGSAAPRNASSNRSHGASQSSRQPSSQSAGYNRQPNQSAGANRQPNQSAGANRQTSAQPAAATRAPPQRPVAAAKPSRPKRPELPKMRALWDYQAADVDELNFAEGAIIEVVKKDESGWWTGKLNGRQGLFPSNYVEEC